jgi:hypothetical protein
MVVRFVQRLGAAHLAVTAGAAGQDDVHHDAVADGDGRVVSRAGFDDGAAKLVAEDAGRLDLGVAVAVGAEIGAADAAGVDGFSSTSPSAGAGCGTSITTTCSLPW